MYNRRNSLRNSSQRYTGISPAAAAAMVSFSQQNPRQGPLLAANAAAEALRRHSLDAQGAQAAANFRRNSITSNRKNSITRRDSLRSSQTVNRDQYGRAMSLTTTTVRQMGSFEIVKQQETPVRKPRGHVAPPESIYSLESFQEEHVPPPRQPQQQSQQQQQQLRNPRRNNSRVSFLDDTSEFHYESYPDSESNALAAAAAVAPQRNLKVQQPVRPAPSKSRSPMKSALKKSPADHSPLSYDEPIYEQPVYEEGYEQEYEEPQDDDYEQSQRPLSAVSEFSTVTAKSRFEDEDAEFNHESQGPYGGSEFKDFDSDGESLATAPAMSDENLPATLATTADSDSISDMENDDTLQNIQAAQLNRQTAQNDAADARKYSYNYDNDSSDYSEAEDYVPAAAVPGPTRPLQPHHQQQPGAQPGAYMNGRSLDPNGRSLDPSRLEPSRLDPGRPLDPNVRTLDPNMRSSSPQARAGSPHIQQSPRLAQGFQQPQQPQQQQQRAPSQAARIAQGQRPGQAPQGQPGQGQPRPGQRYSQPPPRQQLRGQPQPRANGSRYSQPPPSATNGATHGQTPAQKLARAAYQNTVANTQELNRQSSALRGPVIQQKSALARAGSTASNRNGQLPGSRAGNRSSFVTAPSNDPPRQLQPSPSIDGFNWLSNSNDILEKARSRARQMVANNEPLAMGSISPQVPEDDVASVTSESSWKRERGPRKSRFRGSTDLSSPPAIRTSSITSSSFGSRVGHVHSPTGRTYSLRGQPPPEFNRKWQSRFADSDDEDAVNHHAPTALPQIVSTSPAPKKKNFFKRLFSKN